METLERAAAEVRARQARAAAERDEDRRARRLGREAEARQAAMEWAHVVTGRVIFPARWSTTLYREFQVVRVAARFGQVMLGFEHRLGPRGGKRGFAHPLDRSATAVWPRSPEDLAEAMIGWGLI